MKPKVVLSGVNVREVGSLTIFRGALATLARECGNRYEVIALVKSRELFDVPGVTYLEFPHLTRSWLTRLRFEYWSMRAISARLRPKLWLSMNDVSPNVFAESRAVYCHNASLFYRSSVSEFLLDWRFGMFTLLYRYLYGINLRANDHVIVQQDWMRNSFRSIYGARNVIVAHPAWNGGHPRRESKGEARIGPYRFFYPMYPRTYKNPELCLEAARILERRGFPEFELWLTFSGETNRYAAHVVKQFADVRSVRWLGLLPHERVLALYEEADCLLYPSKLESWGLPISEFRAYGKPILVADLPYAHETIAGHGLARFFDPDDAAGLADLMAKAAVGERIFTEAPAVAISEPYAKNWSEMFAMLLPD